MADRSLRIVTSSLKRRSEDAWGVARRGDGSVSAAWVIDGATPLGAAEPRTANEQVSCFAWSLSSSLRDALSAPAAELTAAVETARARAAKRLADRWPQLRHPGQMPTATLSLVRRTVAGLEVYVLGDSPLWIETDDGEPVGLEDPQFRGGEQRLIRSWHRLREQGMGAREAYDRLLEGQAAGRARRNTPDGLWILGDSPQAAAHGHRQMLPGSDPRRVCLLSDGLERAVAPFGLLGRTALFEALHEGRALRPIQSLRAAERADDRRLVHPRLGVHDDITGLAAML